MARAVVPLEHVSAELGHAPVGMAEDEAFTEDLLFVEPFSEETVELLEPLADRVVVFGIFVFDPRFPVAVLIEIVEGDKKRMRGIVQIGIDARADQFSVDRSIDKGLEPAPLCSVKNAEEEAASTAWIFRENFNRLLQNARRAIIDRDDFSILEMDANIGAVQLIDRTDPLFKNPLKALLQFRSRDVLFLLIESALERAFDLGKIDNEYFLHGQQHKELNKKRSKAKNN